VRYSLPNSLERQCMTSYHSSVVKVLLIERVGILPPPLLPVKAI